MAAAVIAFRCAREGFEAAATQLLGGFDGRDRREVHVYAVDTRPEQLMVSMHEQLHHELHWSTRLGTARGDGGLLSEAGVDTERLRPVAAAANATCRRVHEVFATTIAAGALGIKEAELLLAGNREYLAHLRAGLHVAGSSSEWPWQFRESACQMLLRTLMQPAELAGVADRGFESGRPLTAADDVAAGVAQNGQPIRNMVDERSPSEVERGPVERKFGLQRRGTATGPRGEWPSPPARALRRHPTRRPRSSPPPSPPRPRRGRIVNELSDVSPETPGRFRSPLTRHPPGQLLWVQPLPLVQSPILARSGSDGAPSERHGSSNRADPEAARAAASPALAVSSGPRKRRTRGPADGES